MTQIKLKLFKHFSITCTNVIKNGLLDHELGARVYPKILKWLDGRGIQYSVVTGIAQIKTDEKYVTSIKVFLEFDNPDDALIFKLAYP